MSQNQPRNSNRSTGPTGRVESDALRRFLEAEEAGSDAEAERALLTLMASLPEPAPRPGFARRVVTRLERELRPPSRWTPRRIVLNVLGAILLCGSGVLALAALVGIDVTASTPLSAFRDLGGTLIELPFVLAAAAARVAGWWVELRSAVWWVYTPEFLLLCVLALAVGGASLALLLRLLPARLRPETV